ncbi:mechanosensitive ion channel [Chloroflexi bacterium TSY]|nr:mechanosensitive ion channel [Chloroflexi bacterium TSY]
MMTQSLIQQDLFFWGVGLISGLIVLVIVLGEVIERLERRENPLTEGLRQIRHVVLPILTLLLALRHVLGMAGSSNGIRLLETLVWITVIYALLTLLSNTTRLSESNPQARISKVPTIFFALSRAVVVLFVAYHLLTNVWQVDVSNLFTAVGVGALAISFALQDTLSNLVSGFLLLIDSPFKAGDMIEVEGEWLEVTEVNWRSTRCIADSDWTTVVIPNGILGQKRIKNMGSKEMSRYKFQFTFAFSYNDPPNRVIEIIQTAVNEIEQIDTAATHVVTDRFEKSAVLYQACVVCNIHNHTEIRDALTKQIYYAARRHGLTIALPVQLEYSLDDQLRLQPVYDLTEMLRTIPLLRSLQQDTIEWLSARTQVNHFGLGERMIRQGEPDDGYYLIYEGEVQLSSADPDGHHLDIMGLSAGDIFGELTSMRGEPSPVTATATTDTTVLILGDETIEQLIERNHGFSIEMHAFIEERNGLSPP